MTENTRTAAPPLAVGWLIDIDEAAFSYKAPQAMPPGVLPLAEAESAAAGADPDGARYFQVACPFTLRLRPRRDQQGNLRLANSAPGKSSVGPLHLSRVISLMEPHLWRHPERPMVQISTPYRFVADEPVWLTQLPPFAFRHEQPWPGVVVGGRLPAHIWPRKLSWAFEWHQPDRDLVLNAGEPWFYLKFEPQDAARRIKMVDAAWNPALRNYCKGLDGVIFYVNRTFSLFDIARQRRPTTLLTPAERS